jgi:hypothetical protein
VIIVPEHFARLGVERIDVAERRCHKHDPVDHDWRRFQGFLDVGLENPCDVQVLHVVPVDLLCGVKARLGIVAVGQQKIGRVLVCRIELILSDRGNLRLARDRPEILLDFLRLGLRANSPGRTTWRMR